MLCGKGSMYIVYIVHNLDTDWLHIYAAIAATERFCISSHSTFQNLVPIVVYEPSTKSSIKYSEQSAENVCPRLSISLVSHTKRTTFFISYILYYTCIDCICGVRKCVPNAAKKVLIALVCVVYDTVSEEKVICQIFAWSQMFAEQIWLKIFAEFVRCCLANKL